MISLQLLISFLLVANILGIEAAAYNHIISYDPRYMIRRVPVRRSVMDFETRVPSPITRYFPQVDAQVAPYPYVAREAVAPAAYRLPTGEVYVVPPRWPEDAVPVSAVERTDENDYGAYDYDSESSPVYGRTYQSEPYAIPQEGEIQDNDGDLYNDMMVNYFLTGLQPDMEDNEFSEVQRRSQEIPLQYGTVEQQKDEPKAQNESEPPKAVQSTSSAPAVPEASTLIPVESSSVVAAPAAPPAPVSTAAPFDMRPPVQRYPQFSMARRSSEAAQGGQWNPFVSSQQGQKEYPFYRQAASTGQKSPMASLEEQMSRGKNTSAKNKQDAFSLIEKMMSSQQVKDPLTEQLESLKFRNM